MKFYRLSVRYIKCNVGEPFLVLSLALLKKGLKKNFRGVLIVKLLLSRSIAKSFGFKAQKSLGYTWPFMKCNGVQIAYGNQLPTRNKKGKIKALD